MSRSARQRQGQVRNAASREPREESNLDKGTTIMSTITSEVTTPGTILTAGETQPEFSQEYSKGKLEEMSSRELLDRYAE